VQSSGAQSRQSRSTNAEQVTELITPASVVIIGASLAGVRCATQLRRSGFIGEISIVNGEQQEPYDRPPLSKKFLSGEWDADRLALLPDDKLSEIGARWFNDTRATSLDVSDKTVELSTGESLKADAIVIATGATPRRLPATEGLGGVHVLRTLTDADGLRAELSGEPRRVVVVGAGFIGAEVASTASTRGHSVTIVEAADVPMERGLGREMGLFCGGLHADHGVDLRLSTSIADVVGDEGRVSAVVLGSGEQLPADIVVVGIGVEPNTTWLAETGLTLDNGVLCNAYCEAAPGIFAAGDIARWHNERFDETMRVEHWGNAVEQGIYVAKRIMGELEPFTPVPWFWSDQYDHKIQLAGRPSANDTVEVVTGSLEERRCVAIYGRGERLTGVFGLNRPRDVMQYRRLITEGACWQDALDFADEARQGC
jgi:3-phenylpropionate/trans-cinnamate dioxygenase ferredoxin reductase subunit